MSGNGAGATLREAHRADTRERIVRALGDLLTEEHPASLSVPAVARRAGVSVATVYRYFPSKEALLEAGSEIADQLLEQGGAPASAEDLEAFLRHSAASFQAWAPLVQAQLVSPVGREIRRHRLPRALAAVRGSASALGVDTDTAEGERLVRVVTTLASSVSIIDLMERQGCEPDEVAADLTWAVMTLLRVTRDEQQDRPKSRSRRGT